jgi:hypothetical protein
MTVNDCGPTDAIDKPVRLNVERFAEIPGLPQELTEDLQIQLEAGAGNWAIQESSASRKLNARIGNVKCVADDWYVQKKWHLVPAIKRRIPNDCA